MNSLLCCLVGDPFVLAKEASKKDGWATVGKSSSFRLLVYSSKLLNVQIKVMEKINPTILGGVYFW